MRQKKIWGWGYEGEGADADALAFAEASLGALLGPLPTRREPPSLDRISLRPPRCPPPPRLDHVQDTPRERALHALGRSWRDLARASRGRFENPPDYVFYPTSEADVARALEAADEARLAVVPFGGGTSVSGGVEPIAIGDLRGTLTIDLSHLSKLREVDEASGAARIEAGASGPELEAALKAHGLSLRFFPQSFELSTLGGWIATRAGGHFATGPTHIDDLVESVRLVTPRGTLATRRLPASGAGPQPERLVLGSEGTLGIITEAWVRVFRRPTRRSATSVAFEAFSAGARALRAILQAGLLPTNARLIDGPEAIMSGAGAGDTSLLLLAQESADLPTASIVEACADIACQHGGKLVREIRTTDAGSGGRDATGETYRAAFFRAPYLRDELVLRGVFVETYETAITWDRLDALDDAVRQAVRRAVPGPHLLACRITHAYRDGCAPYYTVICRAPDDDDGLGLWADVKAAITNAVVDAGGTSTHHHAVGRDVVPFHARERSPLFESALRGAKRALDPNGILNPGVLFAAAP